MKINRTISIRWVLLASALSTAQVSLNVTGRAQVLSGDHTGPTMTEPTVQQTGQINGIEFGRQVEVRDGIATIEPDGLHVKVTREMTYRDFLFQTGWQDRSVDQAVAKGERPSSQKQHFHERILVTEEGDQAIHSIADDTFQQLDAVEKKYEADLYGFRESTPEEWKSKEKVAWLERVEKRDAVVEQAMTRLKQELSEDDFRKTDSYIYKTENGGRETLYRYTPVSKRHIQDLDHSDIPSTRP